MPFHSSLGPDEQAEERIWSDARAATEAVLEAQRRMAGHVRETPVVTCASIDAIAGRRVFFKAENLQRTGSYKPRGAFSLLLSERERHRLPETGVVADSSGNYGQAVAFAARELGVPAAIVTPETANPMKAAAIRDFGAELVQAGVTGKNRGEVAATRAAVHSMLYAPADRWEVIAGDGTLSLEVASQVEDFDAIFVPVSTGSLLAGQAPVVKHLVPQARVVGVQPSASGHAKRSLESGRVHELQEPPDTIADGARTLAMGERPFEVIRRFVDEVVLVDEEQILQATWLLWTRAKMVVEPTGALALAGALFGGVSARQVVCVVSGGNADVADLGARFAAAGLTGTL